MYSKERRLLKTLFVTLIKCTILQCHMIVRVGVLTLLFLDNASQKLCCVW